jgi:acyl-CoA-binding protein
MTTEAKFNKAAEIIKGLPKDGPVKPTQDDQLNVGSFKKLFAILEDKNLQQFYKYFKQATLGDVKASRPGGFDFTGKAKW